MMTKRRRRRRRFHHPNQRQGRESVGGPGLHSPNPSQHLKIAGPTHPTRHHSNL
jgi:hypothetical protein